MKKTIVLIFCLLLSLGTLSCSPAGDLVSVSGGYVQIEDEQVTPEYVLELDGEKVSFDEYRYFFLNLVDSMADGAADPAAFWTDEKQTELKNQTLDFILKAKAMNAYAKEKGLQLTEAEKASVEDYVNSIKSNLGDEDFETQLTALHLTESLYRRLQAEEKTYEKIYNHLFKEGGEMAWSDEQFNEYYAQNYLCATHILLDFLPGETKDNCPKTLEEAHRIHSLCATEDFSSLIKQYGKDPNLENFPTGYYFKEGDMVESFYTAAKALAVGEISSPVISPEGVHIIRRLEPNAEQVALQKESILWGSSSADGTYTPGVYAALFEEFYQKQADGYAEAVVYNPRIEAYLKPGLVF